MEEKEDGEGRLQGGQRGEERGFEKGEEAKGERMGGGEMRCRGGGERGRKLSLGGRGKIGRLAGRECKVGVSGRLGKE